jgi:hypothetical protein
VSDTLSLATRLRAMSDAELTAAMRAREVGVGGIKDFFDLAEAFLDRASIQQMLTRLDRETLAVLAAIGQLTEETGPPTAADVAHRLAALSGGARSPASIAERAATATGLLLLEAESHRFAAYESVRDQLRSWPAFGLPSLGDLTVVTAPAALEPVPDVDHRFIDRLGAERAFAAITAITELLVEVERDPARELAKGGVALPDSKRLANAMAVDLQSVATFLAVADRAGLVARETGSWMITEHGAAWLLRSTGARWATLGSAWFERLPGDIRDLLGERTHALWGSGLRGYIDWLYPAGGDWMDERISAYTRDAELLGITANQAPTGPGSLLLADGILAAEDAMTALLPAEVEQVYLQHDLSVVAPGPLTPRVDARLRSLADVESRALASSYRVSTSSVNRAMAAGETAESILEFLSGISLTGIPQPLDYLIGEASSRYGQVRVGSIDDPGPAGRSYIRSDDELLIGTILVDQNLSALGFERTATGRAVSRFPLELVVGERCALPGRGRERGGGDRRAEAPTHSQARAGGRGEPDRVPHRTAQDRRRAGGRRDRSRLARAPAGFRHQGEDAPHRHGHDAGRHSRGLPARADERRRRPVARPRQPRRHRAHPAAVAHREDRPRALVARVGRSGTPPAISGSLACLRRS